MTRTLAVRQSRVIPIGVDQAFTGTLPTTGTWHWNSYPGQSLATLSTELTR
ncbi:hypothetical protein [Mycobacterium sp.]|uniref:hypothetical protein n=1 Tax=Mycobacterium sp. TaxID=1785 RepID=UPI0031D3F7AA